MEQEENSIIPFLDTLIQRNQDGTISVKVYRKPTHTNQYLSFTSRAQHGLSPSGNLINMHKIDEIASVGFNSHLLANT